MELTSTQIGAVAENLVANELMIESMGRLSPFQPIADDDGLDVLIYDKVTGRAVPIQIKARTKSVKKAASNERGNIVHFEVRKSSHRDDRHALLLCVLLSENLRSTERAWLLPLHEIHLLSSNREKKFVIQANKQLNSNDKYKKFRCSDIGEVSRILIRRFEDEDLFQSTHQKLV